MSDKAPDLVEPFLGWKGLLADKEGGLWSPSMGGEAAWPAYEEWVATCPGHEEHETPERGCGCGFYAVKSFEELRTYRYNWREAERGKVWVIATLSLYGRVRQGRIGYRAQLAYPKRIYIPAHKLPLGPVIRARYGVPFGVIDRFTGERLTTRRT